MAIVLKISVNNLTPVPVPPLGCRKNSDLRNAEPAIFDCTQSDFVVQPGIITKDAGIAAGESLSHGTKHLIKKKIDALVTMPVNKSNIFFKNNEYFIGHTEYLRDKSKSKETLMLLINNNLKIATLTNHIPISQVSSVISKRLLISKLEILINSLKKDFLIQDPRVAVLGLNPHNGDSGLVGREEIEIITPVVKYFCDIGLDLNGLFQLMLLAIKIIVNMMLYYLCTTIKV